MILGARAGVGGLGAALTMPEIYQVARQAGFPPETAVKMTAIAMKESRGVTTAYNGSGPDDSYGLWQINMIGNLGPARLEQFGLDSKDELFDPVTNARAAYLIWNGDDRNLDLAWAINRGVNKDRYEQFLPQVESAIGIDPETGLPAGEDHDPEDTGETGESGELLFSPVLIAGIIGAGMLILILSRRS